MRLVRAKQKAAAANALQGTRRVKRDLAFNLALEDLRTKYEMSIPFSTVNEKGPHAEQDSNSWLLVLYLLHHQFRRLELRLNKAANMVPELHQALPGIRARD